MTPSLDALKVPDIISLESDDEKTNWAEKNNQRVDSSPNINIYSDDKQEEIPLIKIIFRDNLTARKYHHRMKDIINYVLSTSNTDLNETDVSSDADLELKIYESYISKFNVIVDYFSKLNKEQPTKINKKRKKENISSSTENKKKKTNDQICEALNHTSKNCPAHMVKNFTNKDAAKDKLTVNIEDMPENYSQKTDSKMKTHTKIEKIKSIDNCIEIIDLESNKKSKIENKKVFNKICAETYFENCYIQIGSFGYTDEENEIMLSKEGLIFFTPTVTDTGTKITIKLDDIMRVFVNFSSIAKPVLIIYIFSKKADEIKKLLGSSYPNSTLPQKIKIFPSSVTREFESIIKIIFEPNKLLSTIDTLCIEDIVNTDTKCINKESNFKSNDENELSEAEVNLETNSDMETSLICRVVKLGNFEYAKKRIFCIKKDGVKFCLPNSTGTSTETVFISIKEVTQIAVNFADTLPIIIFYIPRKSEASKMINKITGKRRTNKIIIFPEKLSQRYPALQHWKKLGKLKILCAETLNTHLEQLFKSPVTQINLLSNHVRIGDYEYMSNNHFIELSLSERGYNINIPPKNNAEDFVKIALDFKNIKLYISHMSHDYNVVHFVFNEKIAKKIENLVERSIFLKCDKSKIKPENATEGLSKSTVTFYPKITNDDPLQLFELLYKTGTEFYPKDQAMEEVNKW